MKKTILFFIILLLQNHGIGAQQLIDLYKNGSVIIQPDSNYVTGKLKSYDVQETKNITNLVLDDENNLYMLNRLTNRILVFEPDGRFKQTIALPVTKSTSVYHGVNGLCILDNRYLLVYQYANILVLDKTGNMIKSIKFDYPLYDIVALKDDKIGIKGYISLGGSKVKWHIAVFDIESRKEIPITHFFKDFSHRKEVVSFKIEGKGAFSFSNNKHAPKIFIDRTVEGNLIVGNSGEPAIRIYSPDGKMIHQIKLNYAQTKVDTSEMKGYFNSFREKLIELNAPDSLLQIIQSPEFYYKTMPYYYDLMVDTDGNILVFRYTQKKDHVFRVYQVYSSGGEFVCECKLDSGTFEVPNLRLVAFHDKYLYGLFDLKRDGDDGMRLVRGKLE